MLIVIRRSASVARFYIFNRQKQIIQCCNFLKTLYNATLYRLITAYLYTVLPVSKVLNMGQSQLAVQDV